VTNRGDLLAPPRTARPRHKATPARPALSLRRPGLALRRAGLPTALRKVTAARLDRVSFPTGTGGVASGLAVASIGALVTIMIANSGHTAAQPRPVVPATRMTADMPSLHMPRPVYHPHTVTRRKRHRPHHAPQQVAAGQQAPTADPLSGIGNGINWRAVQARAGPPPWAQWMLSSWGQALAQRNSSAGQPPAQSTPGGQVPAQQAPNAQPPSWP
jgi:hypothetical protein